MDIKLSQCEESHMEARPRCVVLPDRTGPRGRPLYSPPEDAHAEHQREPGAADILERCPNKLQGTEDKPLAPL
eukprot:scaffold29610_cov28-Tisochrysis_lutea.AAC.1